MGLPPRKPRGRRRSGQETVLRGLLLLVFVLAVLPVMIDMANGFAKPTDGCRVLVVVDGDTVKMLCPDRGFVSARLLGFDTPEISDPQCLGETIRGFAATYALRWKLWTAGRIATVTKGNDRYDRVLTMLLLDGTDVAVPMIAAGHARAYGGGTRRGWCGPSP